MHRLCARRTDHGGQKILPHLQQRRSAKGKSAQDAVILSGYTWMEQAKDAVDTVENATDEDLAYIVEKGLPLTLDSLREAAANRTSGTAASESQAVGTVASSEAQSEDAAQSIANESYTPKGQQLLTARRQLEEIRLANDGGSKLPSIKTGGFH